MSLLTILLLVLAADAVRKEICKFLFRSHAKKPEFTTQFFSSLSFKTNKV